MEFGKISVDDRVLCKDASTGIYYDAKILEKEEQEFLIHYQGWNKRFDEWIQKDDAEDRILPFSQEKLNENKRLLNDKKAEAKRLAAGASDKKTSSPVDLLKAIFSSRSESPQASSQENSEQVSRKRTYTDYPILAEMRKRTDVAPSTPSQPKTILPISSPAGFQVRKFVAQTTVPGIGQCTSCICGVPGCKLQLPTLENAVMVEPLTSNLRMQLVHCGDCGSAFENGLELSSHQKRHCGNDAGASSETRYIVKPGTSTGGHLTQHRCSICNEAFVSSAALENHVNTKHATQCAICQKFVLITMIESHLRAHSSPFRRHPVPPNSSAFSIRCKKCQQVFTVTQFSAHQKCCPGVPPRTLGRALLCRICQKVYLSRTNWIEHIFSAHGNCGIQCKTCSTVLRSKQAYLDHTSVCPS